MFEHFQEQKHSYNMTDLLSISLIRLEWQRIEQKKVIKKMTEIIELIYIVNIYRIENDSTASDR